MVSGEQSQWGYLVMWEFMVKPGMEARFEQVYGSAGDWARLFRQDKNYLGTELNRECEGSRRYITLDFWTSEQAYEKFRAQHLGEYQAIDQQCESLTESECQLATLVRAGSD